MIQLSFIRGSALRRVFIKDRTISLLTGELNNVPLKIDLDKLEEQKERIEKMQFDAKMLKELSRLQTEKEISLDVIDDFEKSGWKRVRR